MTLERKLQAILEPGRVLTRPIHRVAFASDASVYRLVPQAVVFPSSLAEIQALFRLSRAESVPLTFRAAGTSLSGQAVTDGILAVVSRHFKRVRVEDGGHRVRVEPGVIGGAVNRLLREHGRKIGPDPASIDSCMMGGILANNSSGMCCGVEHNAYHTLRSISFVLPGGLALDSAAPGAAERLAREAPALAQGLAALKARIEADPVLSAKIRRKYRLKNTVGYSLNAFLDFAEPLEILAHLLIGSEGTLGFIAEAVLETVPDEPLKYTGLLYFADVPRACAAVGPLRESGARALELMDRASLRSIEQYPGVPARIRELSGEAAALLVEYQCGTEETLEAAVETCRALLPALPLVDEPAFTREAEAQALLWRVRKGIIPTVGALRPRATSCILEDVVFPPERLALGVAELQGLCVAHGYDDVALFGHARDGNLHFVLTQAFERRAEIERYDAFMHGLAELVAVRHGGALKAEHGTGRNMAPFVEAEWGREAYAVMRELKRLVDPAGLLNPGVILNDDPRAHVQDLKSLPVFEAEADRCIECGFCERTCPSRELTLTPRQRIVVLRELARLEALETPAGARARRALAADFAYDGLATCAADGLCATTCPVEIDTGRLVKRLRAQGHSPALGELARLAAQRFAWLEPAARAGLRVGRLLGLDWPRPARGGLPSTSRTGAAAVYLPACVSRAVGPTVRGEGSLPALFVRVAARAGAPLWLPPEVVGHCCGLAFASRGFPQAAAEAAARTLEALSAWSEGGRLPVVVDASPCAQALKEAARGGPLRVLDSIDFAHDVLLPRCPPRRLPGRVALHPTCSAVRMGLVPRLLGVASACAEAAEIPPSAGCCGFAGDRGLFRPELPEAATRAEACELRGREYRGYYSTSPTCEFALARATARPYRHLWSLIDEATGDTLEGSGRN